MAVETLAGKVLAWYVSNLNEGFRDVSPTVRARYLVACDGSHSQIRQALGIRMLGHGVLSKSITIYFRGNVGPLLRGRNLSVIYVYNSELTGFFRIEKPFDTGFLAVNSMGPPERPVTDVWRELNDERCQKLMRAALGVDNIPITIENVMKWQATADTAERFDTGRVFLAGDSAHVMPPTGGFGGNTGVQDAHNLAWKLAMVLQEKAGPGLLATYDAERRPIGAFTVEQAYSRMARTTAACSNPHGRPGASGHARAPSAGAAKRGGGLHARPVRREFHAAGRSRRRRVVRGRSQGGAGGGDRSRCSLDRRARLSRRIWDHAFGRRPSAARRLRGVAREDGGSSFRGGYRANAANGALPGISGWKTQLSHR